MPGYRTPTAKEAEKLERARKMMQQGIEGEKDITSRLMPTMAKSARDEQRAAKQLRESVSESAREGEAYNQAGHKKGGVTMARKKARRFDDGGMVGNSNYPFGQAQGTSAPAPTSPGLGNNSPLVQVSTPGAAVEETMEATKPFGMKKGGMTASRRGDGVAQRGKTRGRMV
jgi:hypothetical protein